MCRFLRTAVSLTLNGCGDVYSFRIGERSATRLRVGPRVWQGGEVSGAVSGGGRQAVAGTAVSEGCGANATSKASLPPIFIPVGSLPEHLPLEQKVLPGL